MLLVKKKKKKKKTGRSDIGRIFLPRTADNVRHAACIASHKICSTPSCLTPDFPTGGGGAGGRHETTPQLSPPKLQSHDPLSPQNSGGLSVTDGRLTHSFAQANTLSGVGRENPTTRQFSQNRQRQHSNFFFNHDITSRQCFEVIVIQKGNVHVKLDILETFKGTLSLPHLKGSQLISGSLKDDYFNF